MFEKFQDLLGQEMPVLTEYTGVNEDEITVHKGETVQVKPFSLIMDFCSQTQCKKLLYS